jgi:hypothetical protein
MANLFAEAIWYRGQVIISIKIVVAQTHYNLAVMLAGPIPEYIFRISVAFRVWQIKICSIASDKQNITRYLQWMFFNPLTILRELQMEVANILDPYAMWYAFIIWLHHLFSSLSYSLQLLFSFPILSSSFQFFKHWKEL